MKTKPYFLMTFQVNPLLAEDSHENQALFSSKDKSKKLKFRLLQFLFATLRVKPFFDWNPF